MSTKNQNTTPTPESVFAAIAQSAEPLTIKDLVSVSATWSRPVLNGIVSQLQRENKIEVIGEAPARFRAIAAGNEQAANPAATQSKPSGNVVSITPKMAGKPQQTEQVEQNTPAQPASSQSQDDLLAKLVQQLKTAPAPIPDLEEQYGDEATRLLIKTLDERHLIVHHRILNTDTIELSPKGEEFYLSLEKTAPAGAGAGEQSAAGAGANQASEDDEQSSAQSANASSDKAAAASAQSNQQVTVEADQPVRRKPGRPKGSKTKPKDGVSAKGKSATPKSATAVADTGAKAASTNPPAAEQPAPAQPAPAAQATPSLGNLPAGDFNTQLLALLSQAAQGAVAQQLQEQTERRDQQAKLANDVSEISDLMLELGKRLKILSEDLIKP